MDSTGAIVVITALLGVTAVFAVVAQRRKQRVTRSVKNEVSATTVSPAEISVLQFSTELCSRCPGVERMIRKELHGRGGVRFEHIDLTQNLELAQTHKIMRTPTVLLVDSLGNTLSRLDGAITVEAFRAELSHHTGDPQLDTAGVTA